MRIFLASHGRMASGMKNSCDVLLGNSDKLTVYDAYLDERSAKEVIDEFMKSIDSEESVLLLSDIFGGSVNQYLSQYTNRPNTFLVAGVNLAFLLEVMLAPELNATTLDQLIDKSRLAMQRVVMDDIAIEEEEFF